MSSKVKVSSDGTLRNTHIYVGGQELRVTRATIMIDVDKPVRIDLETYADIIDVEALEQNTELNVVRLDR